MLDDIGYKKSFKKLQEYGLSFQSCIGIMEAVSAYNQYEVLPQTTKDSMQAISDLYNVSFTFTLLKRKKLALTGISTYYRATYLYTDETLKDRDVKKYWSKNHINFYLHPNSGNKLEKEII